MDVVSSGLDPADPDEYRWVVVGSPGPEEEAFLGGARVIWADIATGTLDPTHPYTQTLYPYPVSVMTPPPGQYGWDVLAVDVRDCHPAASAPYEDGCGQEILLSAPDTATGASPGAFYWYESDGDVAARLFQGPAWQYAGRVNPPASVLAGGQFGYAFAAPEVPDDPDSPWAVGDTTTPWIAVSAPGSDRVIIYAVNQGSSTPFTVAQVLVAPITSRRFGHALAVGDFNDDGLPDLAVGGPQRNGADLEGRVWIYRGESVTASPFVRPAPLEVDGRPLSGSSTFGADEGRFGWSLAAGEFVGDHLGDALVVGSPWAGPDTNGGLCQFVVVSDTSGSGLRVDCQYCWANEFASVVYGAAKTEELGYRVAVGNFYNVDGQDRSDTPKALHPEIAVSRPGYDPGTAVDAGQVEVLMTDADGFRGEEPIEPVLEYTGMAAGARFGEAMRAGFVQMSYWEDLAIGAPSHEFTVNPSGTASLTRALTTSACDEVNAYWEATDLLGNTVTVKIFNDDATGEMEMVFEDDYWIGAMEDYGLSTERQCQQPDPSNPTVMVNSTYRVPAGTTFRLPHLWQCGGSPTEFWGAVDAQPLAAALGFGSVIGAGAYFIDVDMELRTSTELDFALVPDAGDIDTLFLIVGMDDNVNCELEPLSGTLRNPNFGICE